LVSLEGKCPPCRSREEEARAELRAQQEDEKLALPVTLVTDGRYDLVVTEEGRFQAGYLDFTSAQEALEHWSDDGERATLFRNAILEFVRAAGGAE
jgi:hypothetical protein